MGQGRDSPLGLRLDHAACDVQAIQVLTLDDQLVVSGVEGLQNDAVAPLDIPLEGAFALVAVDQHTQVAVFQRALAVDKGQTEAARSLGLSGWQSMRLVVLPQAIKNVLPALANEVVTMVKESSICSVLGMAEIMYTAQTVSGNSYITLAPYVLAALVYFCINYPASKAIEAIERRMRRGDKQ